MAVLQKIRNRGVLLVSAIAVALFLFVIGDLIRGGEGLIQRQRQNVGEVDGESVHIQDYQELFEEFQTYQEIAQQKSSFNEDETNQIKDYAWQTYVQNQLIEKECKALGIAVTDEEVQQIIRTGASQMLQVPIFMNQQGQYDYGQVSSFLTSYKKMKDSGEQIPEQYEKIYKFFLFVQKQIRYQYMAQKYQILLSKCFLSNPVEAKQNFEARTNESNVLLVSVPFTSISDDKVSVSDDEIKNKYNADKAKYEQFVETRDLKVVDVKVVASDADKKALEKEMNESYKKLEAAADNDAAGNVVRQATSLVNYTNVYKTKDAFPQMIASLLDGDSTSLSAGALVKPTYDAMSNTYYTLRVMGKTTQADSVLFRQIAVVGKDASDSDKKADSIMNALSAGASFKDIAKKYNQTGDSAWVATAQFQQGDLDADNTTYINDIYAMASGEVKKIKFTNGNTVIVKVEKTAHPVTKYNVAAVVKELKFSDETYSKEYDKFSAFVASNATVESMEANAAKSGYIVRPLENISSSQHTIAGIHNTREALKWAFDDAKPGDVSQLYECGDNDHLMVLALTGVVKEGYAPLDKVKDIIKQELINEKKAEKILEACKSVKDINAAKAVAGAQVDSVNHITFAASTFVRATTASEPVVSALASKTPQGQFAAAVKGNAGVYMLQVLSKNKTSETYNQKSEESQVAQNNFRYAFQNIFNNLYLKAKVKDFRYRNF